MFPAEAACSGLSAGRKPTARTREGTGAERRRWARRRVSTAQWRLLPVAAPTAAPLCCCLRTIEGGLAVVPGRSGSRRQQPAPAPAPASAPAAAPVTKRQNFRLNRAPADAEGRLRARRRGTQTVRVRVKEASSESGELSTRRSRRFFAQTACGGHSAGPAVVRSKRRPALQTAPEACWRYGTRGAAETSRLRLAFVPIWRRRQTAARTRSRRDSSSDSGPGGPLLLVPQPAAAAVWRAAVAFRDMLP